MYLITPLSKPEITSPAVIARLLDFINPVSTSCQLSTNPGDSSTQPFVNPSSSSYREENSAQSPRQPSVHTSSQPSGHPSSQLRPEDGGNLAQSLASAVHPSSPTSAHSSRLANLAQIFLADYCTRDQISAVQRIVSTSQIPLPDTNE
uniref:Uncharacterized protein n=1 Tax=Cacopsylla melanoneura TaxID=428564 RepID=A0A8D9EAS6_9HEMI